jgi:hypothetical protein
LNRRLGELQNKSGCSGDEKTAFPLPGIEPHVCQSIAYSLSPYSLYKENLSLGREYIVHRKRPQCLQSIYKLGIGL